MSKYSWPFRWDKSVNYILDSIEAWISATDKPVTLKRKDFDLLMSKLPQGFLRLGAPSYKGREIKRAGDK